MKRIILLLPFLVPCASGSSFTRLFSVSEAWFCSSLDVCELANGTFAFTQADVMDDVMLFRLDSEGSLLDGQDDMRVPGRSLESGGWVLPASDGGCFVCSYSEPRATGVNSDIALFRLSDEGWIEWYAHIGSGEETVYSGIGAAVSGNGGCAVLGTIERGYGGSFLRMYSPSGDLEWEIDLKEFLNFQPVSLSSAEGGFLILFVNEWGDGALALRVSREGVKEWSTEIPYPCGFGPSASAELSTGYGVYFSDYGDRRDGLYALLAFDGTLIEAVQFSHDVFVSDILITGDGSVVLAGSRVIDGEEGAVLEAFDSRGEPLWSRRMEGPGEDRFTAVSGCADGGYCLTGYMNPGSDGDTFGTVFVKTGPEGVFEGSADPAVIPLPLVQCN